MGDVVPRLWRYPSGRDFVVRPLLNKGVFGRRENPRGNRRAESRPVEPFHEGKRGAWENEPRVPIQEKAAGFPLE